MSTSTVDDLRGMSEEEIVDRLANCADELEHIGVRFAELTKQAQVAVQKIGEAQTHLKEAQRSFDSTCRKLHRFLGQPQG